MNIVRTASQLKTRFDRSVEGLFNLPFWLLAVVVLGANILTQGVWMVPNLDSVYLMARDITQNPYPHSVLQILLSSFLMPLIAYAFGLNTSPAEYFTLCSIVLVVGMAVSFGSLRRRYGDETTRIVVLLFGATPLINVLLTWIGYGDPLTFTLTTLLLALPAPGFRVLTGALLAIAHFEQGAVILIFLCGLLPFLDKEQRHRWLSIGMMIAGFVVGKIAIDLFFQMYHFQIATTRSSLVFEKVGIVRFLTDTIRFPLVLLFSVLNVTWVPWLLIFVASFHYCRRWFAVLGVGMVICLTVMIFTLDQTRVAAILTWPLLVGAVIVAVREIENRVLLRQLAAACFLLGMIVPRVIVWEGQVHTSAASFTVMMISDWAGGTHFIDQSVPYWRNAPFVGPKPIDW